MEGTKLPRSTEPRRNRLRDQGSDASTRTLDAVRRCGAASARRPEQRSCGARARQVAFRRRQQPAGGVGAELGDGERRGGAGQPRPEKRSCGARPHGHGKPPSGISGSRQGASAVAELGDGGRRGSASVGSFGDFGRVGCVRACGVSVARQRAEKASGRPGPGLGCTPGQIFFSYMVRRKFRCDPGHGPGCLGPSSAPDGRLATVGRNILNLY